MHRRTIIRATAAIIFTAGAIGFGTAIQAYEHPIHPAVCHAITEDSVITDCDYHDGGWYQK